MSSLPPWNADCVLPPGVHPAEIPDVYERLVLDAPHRERREVIFAGLRAWLGSVRELVPAGRAWLDGDLVMAQSGRPRGVKVALMPGDWAALHAMPSARHEELHAQVTRRDVIIGRPGPVFVAKVQPVSGLLDAYLVRPEQEQVWIDQWSQVKVEGETVPGLVKGFVEVSWR